MGPSQILSDKQLHEVTQVIEDHHAAFMIRIGLGDLVPPEEVARLVRLGLITKAQVKDLPTDAFTFGLLADALAEGSAQGMDYGDFKEWLGHHEPTTTTEERAAIKVLKRSLGAHLKGLGNVVDKRTHQTLIEADQGLRRRLAAHVKRELVAGVEKRKSVSEIVAGLRESTQSYSRDWTRVAVTEVNNAFQEGKLATIQKANPGRDPWVFKRVQPSSCKDCVEAYTLKSGIPRLFRLSKLLAMGSNVHRKHADRTAVVGSHHPWCSCVLGEMPPGIGFDSSGNLVIVCF